VLLAHERVVDGSAIASALESVERIVENSYENEPKFTESIATPD